MVDQAVMDDWVRRVVGLSMPTSSDPEGDRLKVALARWTKARATAVDSLKELEGAIRELAHPAGDGAIILVKAIAANLTATPDNKGATAELRRYLETDDVIDDAEAPNGFGIQVSLRKPLLDSLAEIEGALAHQH